MFIFGALEHLMQKYLKLKIILILRFGFNGPLQMRKS